MKASPNRTAGGSRQGPDVKIGAAWVVSANPDLLKCKHLEAERQFAIQDSCFDSAVAGSGKGNVVGLGRNILSVFGT